MKLPYAPIRLAIADDHEIFREGLKISLSSFSKGKIEIVAEADNGKQLLMAVLEKKPDVILTDIRMPIMDGLQAVKLISKSHSCIGIIALTNYEDNSLVYDMIEAGAKGYLLKSTSASVIVEAILAVKRGETFYCSAALQSMVRLLPHRDHISQSKASQKRLTEKEVEITKMICKQFTSKEIAHHLQISRRTVEDCSKRIKEKTGAKSIAGIVLHAVKNEIITLNEI